MRLLLDTHALVWFATGSRRLSAKARGAIEDPQSDVWASAASAYEIAIKQRSGRLNAPAVEDIFGGLRGARISVLDLTDAHAIHAGNLPGPHRDPWDRLIMGQAIRERLTVVTVDQAFRDYGVDVLW